MGEKTKKNIEPEKVEAESLDDEELEKIVGGAGPSAPPSYAPDGTILPVN